MKITPFHNSIVGGCSSLLRMIGLFCLINISVAAQQEVVSSTTPSPDRASSVVRGRAVYEDTGKPMRYARVFLSAGKGRQKTRITSTDARGEFTFRNVAAGSYLASVLAPDSFGTNSYPSAPEGGESVSADGSSAVDIKLRGQRGGTITGRVTYSDGEPVVSARITVLRARGEHWNSVAQCCQGSPETDDRGVFRLYGLSPGEYKVGVSEGGLQIESTGDGGMTSSMNQSLLTFFYPAAVGAETATSIKVSQGRAVEGIDIVVQDVRTFSISGIVTLAGQPLRGISLSLQMRESANYSPISKVVTSDTDGKWMFKSVPDGSYTVSTNPGASSMDADPEMVARMRKMVSESRHLTVAGADVDGVSISLTEGGTISGTVVVDGGGALPQHINLSVSPADETPQGRSNETHGQSEAGGSFRIEGVKPGDVSIAIWAYPHGKHYVKSMIWNGKDIIREPLRVPEGVDIKGVRITLGTDVATVTGRVTAAVPAEGGQRETAAAPCIVLLVPADPSLLKRRWTYLWSELSAENRFNMKGAPGEYLVLPMHPKAGNNLAQYIKDHEQGAKRVTLRAKEETKLELSRGCEPEVAK